MAKLREALDKEGEQYKKCCDLLHNIALSDPKLKDDCDKELNTLDDTHMEVVEQVLEMFNELTQGQTNTTPPARARDRPTGGQRMRTVEAPKPFKLTLDHSPQEMRSWVRRFRAFYSTSNLDQIDVEDQLAFMIQSVDLSLIHI